MRVKCIIFFLQKTYDAPSFLIFTWTCICSVHRRKASERGSGETAVLKKLTVYKQWEKNIGNVLLKILCQNKIFY